MCMTEHYIWKALGDYGLYKGNNNPLEKYLITKTKLIYLSMVFKYYPSYICRIMVNKASTLIIYKN